MLGVSHYSNHELSPEREHTPNYKSEAYPRCIRSTIENDLEIPPIPTPIPTIRTF